MTFCWASPMLTPLSFHSSYLRPSLSEDSRVLLSEGFFSCPHLFSLCNFDIGIKDVTGKFVSPATLFPHLKPPPLQTPFYRAISWTLSSPKGIPSQIPTQISPIPNHLSLSNSLQPSNLTFVLSNSLLTTPVLFLSQQPHCCNYPLQISSISLVPLFLSHGLGKGSLLRNSTLQQLLAHIQANECFRVGRKSLDQQEELHFKCKAYTSAELSTRPPTLTPSHRLLLNCPTSCSCASPPTE